jgi:hypothetical protein
MQQKKESICPTFFSFLHSAVSAPVRGNVPEAADGAAMGYFRTLLSYLKGRPDGVTDLPDLSGHRADSLEVAGELLEKWSVKR